MKPITNNRFLCILAIFSLSLLVLSCQKSATTSKDLGAQSSVKIFLTDDPSLVFDKVLLDIQKVEIKVEDSSEQKHESEHQNDVDDNDHHGDVSGGWTAVNINAGIYDILRFRNGVDTLFASTTFPSVKGLKKIRVTLGSRNSVIFGGASFPLILKGNDNMIVIKIAESLVQVNSGSLTNMWIDIDAGASIKKHGNDFELKPSVKLFSKEKAGSVEGRVSPRDAAAVVMAINGTDTATAKPEDSGEFKFIGLKPGTYAFIYHATANNYIDTTVNSIRVGGQEDVKVATVILHK